jgi:hypothetical protein
MENFVFIEPIVQIVVSILAAGMVIWQVGKQRDNQLLEQKENIRIEFKTKLHGEIEDKLAALSDASVAAASIKYDLYTAFAIQQNAISLKRDPIPLSLEMDAVNKAHSALCNATIEVVKVTEKYEIIEPAIKIFQMAFSVALRDLQHTYWPLMIELPNVLPQRSQDGQNIIYKPIATPEQISKINQLTAAYGDAAREISCYVHDMRVEIQNLLLGNLFDHRVPKRVPLDPRHKVVSTDAKTIEALTHYFKNETLWGKESQTADERIRASLRG